MLYLCGIAVAVNIVVVVAVSITIDIGVATATAIADTIALHYVLDGGGSRGGVYMIFGFAV